MRKLLLATMWITVSVWPGISGAAPGDITTVAGGGVNDGAVATEAGLLGPVDVTFDVAGNMYIVEYRGARVRKVDATTGTISTIAGTGVTALWTVILMRDPRRFSRPTGLASTRSETSILTVCI